MKALYSSGACKLRLTRFHKVALRTACSVFQDFLDDGHIQSKIAVKERLPCSVSAIVVEIGLLDPVVDEETEDVRCEIQRQDNEVDPIVGVEKVDSHSAVIHLFALGPQQTLTKTMHGQSVVPKIEVRERQSIHEAAAATWSNIEGLNLILLRAAAIISQYDYAN
jgi:hypothetical protein